MHRTAGQRSKWATLGGFTELPRNRPHFFSVSLSLTKSVLHTTTSQRIESILMNTIDPTMFAVVEFPFPLSFNSNAENS